MDNNEFKEQVNNMLKDEKSLNMNGIMKLATNLFNGNNLANTVTELAQNKKNIANDAPMQQVILSHEEIETITRELKQQLNEIKEQNEQLKDLITEIIEMNKKKRWRMF